MKNILITGINGYLGSKIAELFSGDYNIIGLEISLKNLHRIEGRDYKVFRADDILKKNIFKIFDIYCVIHTATFYGRNNESDNRILYSNTYLPQILLKEAIDFGCKFFINTDTVLDKYTSTYSLTKHQFNDWLKFYSKRNKINIINLRLEHFYGPGTSDTNFITLMVKKMLNNEHKIDLTKGEQNRDFLYIHDLLEAIKLIFSKRYTLKNYENFNLGTTSNTNIKFLLEFIKKTTYSNTNLNFGAIDYRPNELMESKNDISKILSFNWTPKTSVEEGVKEVINYEKNQISKRN